MTNETTLIRTLIEPKINLKNLAFALGPQWSSRWRRK